MTDNTPKSEGERVTDESMYLRKGKRVVCEYFRSMKLGTFSLAGNQLKTTGYFVRVTGVVQRLSAEGPRDNPVNICLELLVESEEPPCSPTPIPGEESLIGTVVSLSPSTVKKFLP